MLDQDAQRKVIVKAGPLAFGERGWQRQLAAALAVSENFVSMVMSSQKAVPNTWMPRLIIILRGQARQIRRRSVEADKLADRLEQEIAG